MESEPVVAVPPSPGGRGLVPSGVAETGQLRSITFPVAGPVRYRNDFGACRDRCRRQHKGVDLIGDRLQPLLAMRTGIVDRLLEHPTAGFGVVIRDVDGWEFHQYHLNNDTPGTDDGSDDGTWRFAEGIVVGGRVAAGQMIGWMGDSGNSEGSVPHTHVEIRTPNGEAINPYWSLRRAQQEENCGVERSAVAAEARVGQSPQLMDPAFLDTGWAAPSTVAALPGVWLALPLTGGRSWTDDVVARMWIGPTGFTPVDTAAARVGDPQYEEDCQAPGANVGESPDAFSISPELGAILATIRAMETGGDYRTQVTSSTASGAYAFLDSSWGGYGGFRRARDAPPAVQDAKAADLAAHILRRNDGDVSTIPVSWYIGHVPRGAEWDTVPPVGANVLTPRQYQARWMAMYSRMLGTPEHWVTGASQPEPTTVPLCRTVLVDLAAPGGQPEYRLTQASHFVDDGLGRAVPAGDDPCDPHRDAPIPPTTRVATLRPPHRR
jgi:murein DD-endopeptidase MepM/ murein hydrolase activator NlpD